MSKKITCPKCGSKDVNIFCNWANCDGCGKGSLSPYAFYHGGESEPKELEPKRRFNRFTALLEEA